MAYTRKFRKFYQQYEDLPAKTTPITAEIKNNEVDTFINVENWLVNHPIDSLESIVNGHTSKLNNVYTKTEVDSEITSQIATNNLNYDTSSVVDDKIEEAISGIESGIGMGDNLMLYPYRDGNPKTNGGVTFTVDELGRVHATGTATSSHAYYYFITKSNWLKQFVGKTVSLSGCPKGGASTKYRLGLYEYSEDGSAVETNVNDVGSGCQMTLTRADYITVAIRIYSGTKVEDLVFAPMLEIGEDIHGYEPPVVGTYNAVNRLKDSSPVENIIHYPYSSSKQDYGVTWTTNADGTISAVGTADASNHPYRVLTTGSTLILDANTPYVISQECNDPNMYMTLYFYEPRTSTRKTVSYTEIRDGVDSIVSANSISISKESNISKSVVFILPSQVGCAVQVRCDVGVAINGTLKPMLERGYFAHGYVPPYYNKDYLYNHLGSGGSTPQHEYSYEEHIVGIWVDGSYIYERTMDIPDSVFETLGEQTYYYPTPIQNISYIIGYELVARKTGANRNGAWQFFPTAHPVASWQLSSLFNVGSTGFMFAIGSSYTGQQKLIDGKFTIRYTKTGSSSTATLAATEDPDGNYYEDGMPLVAKSAISDMSEDFVDEEITLEKGSEQVEL